jgi:SAM-dependent MidA family methyltransferase
LRPFAGIHFSNELLDAMPVDLRGKLVDLEGDNFVFVKRPDAETTINRAALQRIDNLATKLEREFRHRRRLRIFKRRISRSAASARATSNS